MSMKLELSLHATNLKNVAGAFKGTSDPFAVVTQIATRKGTKAKVLGKTEVIKNNLSPDWVRVFPLDYELGSTLKVAVAIFDEVRKGENKSMGSCVFDIAEVLGARGSSKAKRLPKGKGVIFAHVRKSQGSGILRLKLKGTKLKNVEGLFSKSDPFFEVLRKVDSAGAKTWDNVYRSEDIHNNLNPEWKECVLDLAVLCDGDLNRPIKFTIYDHESSGKHKPMGEFETSVNGLQAASARSAALTVKKKGKDAGTITILKAEVSGLDNVAPVTEQMARTTVTPIPVPAFVPNSSSGRGSFVDYVAGGCELNVSIAIDFTGSNGDPRKPGTLHYMNPNGERNDYMKAISSIVSILGKYDSDQMFPVYGFGAKYGGVVRHCFQVGPKEEYHGLKEVLQAYQSVFKSGLVMSGPTIFNEVIETAAARAASAQDTAKMSSRQAYSILLILTDGAVSDVHAAARCLDEVSNSPLSIVIVGVGNADFGAMQFLDDASSPGKRDIAQFVEFNKHCKDSYALTSETLNEIPDQLVGYFRSVGIPPLPPVQRSDGSIVVEDEEEEIDLSLDISEEEIVVTGGGDDFVDGFNAGR